jgi:UDP-GlcNAc:undecaprenyl-phosphate GlcNAc-1-phosphate transferase
VPLLLMSLATFVASVLLTLVVRVAARRWGIVDRPDGERKLHEGPVPLWGGVAVYLAVVLGLVTATWVGTDASAEQVDLVRTLILTAGTVCVFGAIDDRWVLRSRHKLLLQIVAVIPVVAMGYSVDRIVAFGYPIELGWLGVPLTIAWLVGCINALNLLDGMDGLASTVGLVTAVMLAIIATSMGNPHVAVIAVVLAGALAGFLVFNLPPASIFLGDSGSMVIGLAVGILGMQGAMKTSATLAITVPAVIMTLPMFDTGLALVRRKLTGRHFDSADRQHIHHRLLDRGLSIWQTLSLIGALCLTTGAAATAATIFRSDALAWITALAVLVLANRLQLFGHHELALAREAIARSLARLANRSGRPHRSGGPSNTVKLVELSFAEAWARLIEETAALCLGCHI